MALKFLNKKGWHTGSLRNIENVWKAEQKHDAEQKKLEELRKQILEERERSEFRLLQEQAGLVPKQERLDFLYDSGLAVGKSNSDGFKSLEPFPKSDPNLASSSSTKQQQPSGPGALFEEKPQSANDAWRKLHSDPLLLIRQREQEALARVKNNPIQMAMIRKSVEAKKQKDKTSNAEKHIEKHHHKKLKHQKHATSKRHSDLENTSTKVEEKRNHNYTKSSKYKECSKLEDKTIERGIESKKKSEKDLMYQKHSLNALSGPIQKNVQPRRARHDDEYECEKSRVENNMDSEYTKKVRENRKKCPSSPRRREPCNMHENKSIKLSEEERAARLREMQMDAELHEEQRWKRLRKAEEDDAKEASRAGMSSGRNFLDAAHKSVYGAEKGGCSTIEESVRRRTHYSQSKSVVREGNAFRR